MDGRGCGVTEAVIDGARPLVGTEGPDDLVIHARRLGEKASSDPAGVATEGAWMVYLPDGRQILMLWHPDATLEDVHRHVKTFHPKFRLGIVWVGEFEVQPHGAVTGYCPDGRMVNQDMNFATFSDED